MLGWIIGVTAVVVVGFLYLLLIIGGLCFLLSDTPEDK